MSPTQHPRVLPLRVDRELREAVSGGGRAEAQRALARLLLNHGLPMEALEVAPELAQDGAFLAECLLARGPPWSLSASAVERVGRAAGRAAFELTILGVRQDLAVEIADRTPGRLGVELRAELRLRAGDAPTPDPDEDPVARARRAWVQGDAERAVAELEPLFAPGLAPPAGEIQLMRATLARRAGDLGLAARWLSAAQATAIVPLPGLALERLLIALTRLHFCVQDVDQFECLPWTMGEDPRRRMFIPATWRLRRALERVDVELGPFRGTVLTRVTSDGFSALREADDLRFRLASLRRGLLVADAEVVLEAARALGRANPRSALVPSYLAELLHWLGRREEAAAECERAIVLDPTVRWAYLGLAQARMWAGDLTGAEAVIGRVRRRHRGLPTIPAVAGELALLQGQPGAACRLLSEAVRAHPGRWSAGLLLALAHWRSGERAEGQKMVRAMRLVTPEAWAEGVEPDDVEASVQTQLAAMRGNRSSGFITLFHSGREALLVRGYRHPAATEAPPP